MQISEDGDRWEGDLLYNKPFGYGSYYDDNGNRIYSGFMYKGEKIVFGTEFFADTHTIDYCGTFINNTRHGWGCSYSRNGEKLYEGEWAFGNNSDIAIRLSVYDGCNNTNLVHNLIKELLIGSDCFNTIKEDICIDSYNNLEVFCVKNNSLKNVKSITISNNKKLTIIETGKNSFFYTSSMKIESKKKYFNTMISIPSNAVCFIDEQVV